MTTTGGDPEPRGPSAMSLVFGSRIYRGSALSLFFSGLGMSIAMPLLSLYLVEELGASLQLAGLFFLTNLTAPLFGLLVGLWSERLGHRLPLFAVGSLVGAAGFAGMAITSDAWLVFVLNATALGLAGATGGLIYAAVRDQLNHVPTGQDNTVMSTVRLAFSLGFMTGPVLGSVVGGLLGLRAALIAAALATGLQVVWLIGVRIADGPPGPPVARRETAHRRARPAQATGLGPLLAFLGLAVVAMSGDTVKFAYLPLYMERQLGTSDLVRGIVIGLQSVGMVVFTPIAGVLADRFGAPRVTAVAVVAGVVANIGFTIGGHEVVLAVSTVINAMMWAALGGIGISAAHELHPTRVGLASTLFYSTLRFAAVLGGVVGGIGVGFLGVPGVFVLPAILCALSALGLGALALRSTRRLPPTATTDA